jgi:hypothetical protein
MQTPKDIRVKSWAELNEVVFNDAWNQDLGRYRTPFAFRGLSDIDHDLKTSLIRLGGPYVQLEQALLRNFKKYAHRDTSPGDSVWNWLAVAQHHGLPTRLLDWTNSAYIAMHFATINLEKIVMDGAIWCVDVRKIQQWMPAKLHTVLREQSANFFQVDMLSRVSGTLQEFDHLSEEPFAIFFDPPALDDRITNQYAIFSTMSSPEATLDQWLADKPDLYQRIIIPAALKWEVRDKLDLINITERVLFPGLDGLCGWLKRYYSPRTQAIKHDVEP